MAHKIGTPTENRDWVAAQMAEAQRDANALPWYVTGYLIAWVISFFGFWIYAVAEYGFFLGITLGWIPALIAATIVSFFWPIAALAVVVLVAVILYSVA